MSKKSKRMKFLSESVLLEESGLPWINTIVILTIAVLLVLFIIWANALVMDESIEVTGSVGKEMDSFVINGYVPSTEITMIDEGTLAYIDIKGITDRKSIVGVVDHIYETPIETEDENYYLIRIGMSDTENSSIDIENELLEGLDTHISVVTDTRTLLQYMLGNIYDVGRNAFDFR